MTTSEANTHESLSEAILGHAFVWDCPNCGTENFQRMSAFIVKDKEAKKIMVARGEIEEWQDIPEGLGIIMSACSDNVVCRCCKLMFKAIERYADYEPDDDESLGNSENADEE